MIQMRLKSCTSALFCAALWLVALTQVPCNAAPKHTSGLDKMVEELQYGELETALNELPAGAEHDYFAGILANREGHLAESIQLLTQTLPGLRTTDAARSAQALESLTDDYVKSYRYAEASDACDEVLLHFSSSLRKSELDNLKDDCSTFRLLIGAPAQTVSFAGPIQIPTHHSAIGSIDAQLTVNGITGPWILDTGANFSVVSASFARRLRLQLSEEEAEVKGTFGTRNRLRISILHGLNLGSAIVHNVVLLVMADNNLKFPSGEGKTYQIDAIAGFPVLQALGAITFTASGEFRAGRAEEVTTGGARLFMNKLTPLIECGVNSRRLLFSFDTGANGSQFSEHYYRDFRREFLDLPKHPSASAGAGGTKRMDVYVLPKVDLNVGGEQVELKQVSVLPVKVGTDLDDGYGNLGRDLVAGFESFTLDFDHMRFLLGKPK